MKVDTASRAEPPARDARANPASTVPRISTHPGHAHAGARASNDRDSPDRSLADDLPTTDDIALWTALCAAPVEPEFPGEGSAADELAATPSDPSLANAPVPAMQQLTEELKAQLDAGTGSGLDSCSFEVDVPGLGRLQGRMTLRRDRADLELRALTPGLAHALRMTRASLQAGVDQAVDGDVNLFIA